MNIAAENLNIAEVVEHNGPFSICKHDVVGPSHRFIDAFQAGNLEIQQETSFVASWKHISRCFYVFGGYHPIRHNILVQPGAA